jgi:hypothetical protein
MDYLSCVGFCLFLVFRNVVPEAPLAGIRACRTLVHKPERAHDPYLNDGPPPAMVLQLYFDLLGGLESESRRLGALIGPCEAQAMAVRRFAVPDARIRADPYCTYLVAYDGPAEDEHAWLAHYLEHHPRLMARLPAIRELEVYTRVDWICPAAWRSVNCMQRNKVAFDSAAALTAALSSPVRAEMRADYQRLPRFAGGVNHYPMSTRVLLS